MTKKMYASKDGSNDLKSQALCRKLVEPPSSTLRTTWH